MTKLNEVSRGTVLNGKATQGKRTDIQRRTELERALTRKQPCRNGSNGKETKNQMPQWVPEESRRVMEILYLIGCIACFAIAALLIMSML